MVHTKKIIKETFWEIPEEKSYNKITVQDIVNRCQVNRNTFYYHFQDIPTLMIDSIEDWMADVIQKYGTLVHEKKIKSYKCIFVGSLLDWLVLVVSHHHRGAQSFQ